MRKHIGFHAAVAASVALSFGLSVNAKGDPTTQPAGPATVAGSGKVLAEPAPQFTLKPVIVTAERREQSPQDVPASLTAVDSQTIQDQNIQNIKDASHLAPNLNISGFTPPRQSFPLVRGIGAGQNSPAVATYIDGVPQLSSSTSNIQFVDIDRVEFLRGPQGTLYGRDALGGVINIYTLQPDDNAHSDLTITGGNYSLQDYRGGARGPIVPGKMYYAVSGGYVSRDGYSTNTFTGNDLDHVNELFGRFELRFLPAKNWDLRLTLNGERDADGDFPISDLGGLRQHPRTVDHDFEGKAHRNVGQVALDAIFHGQDADFTSVTAFNYFNSKELTDLDETAFNAARRSNIEQQRTVTEEVRLVSPNNRPAVVNKDVTFSWVTGALFFAAGDEPRIGNTETALVSPAGFGFTAEQDANVNTVGIGVYGQGTLTFWDKLDLTLGGRVDYEYQHAELSNTFTPAIAPAFNGSDQKDYTQFQPKFSLDYRFTKQLMAYATVAEGYRAGGFNSTFPTPAQIPFGPERSWSYEVGAKTSLLNNRLTLNADVFHIDWHHLQLETPIPGEPSAFFISNAGDARSTGFETEGDLQVCSGLDLFAGVGFTHARFENAIQPNGKSASGNRLPQAPETTWNVGAQVTVPLPHELRTYARVEVIGVGPYSYDATNIEGQSAYVLTNFRVGVGGTWWRVEGYMNNAFNTNYVPIAFQFPGSASGYVGESGDPMTAGVTLGLNF
jgi:iron complex outermembrane receptor protein